mmetsp:Transcript_6036/g.15366  ORF Transcript_6036/g.15366 Transcript_6036/m.15366 type:complete len:337 (-) Transcript_6036:40-1050(-)
MVPMSREHTSEGTPVAFCRARAVDASMPPFVVTNELTSSMVSLSVDQSPISEVARYLSSSLTGDVSPRFEEAGKSWNKEHSWACHLCLPCSAQSLQVAKRPQSRQMRREGRINTASKAAGAFLKASKACDVVATNAPWTPISTSPCLMSAVALAPVADNLVTTAAPSASSANTTPTLPSRFTRETVFLSVVSGLKQKPQTVCECASKTTESAGGCRATIAFSSIDWVAKRPWPLFSVSRRSVRHFFFSFCFWRWRRFLSLSRWRLSSAASSLLRSRAAVVSTSVAIATARVDSVSVPSARAADFDFLCWWQTPLQEILRGCTDESLGLPTFLSWLI